MIKNRWISRTVTIVGVLTNVVFGDELADSLKNMQDSTLMRLDRVVVSATKSSRKLSESPASVVVITRKEIQASAAKNIDDVLQYASGVQVKRSVGMGEGVPSDIALRGIPGALAAARVLILVDGIPTNVAGTPFLIVNEIPLEAIQRIEIVKGPTSSLYGANALGGVINIITIKGDGKPSFTIAGETSYPFTILDNLTEDKDSTDDTWNEISDETYWNATVQSSGRVGKYDYLVSAGARTIGNYFLNDSVMVRSMVNRRDTTYMKHADNFGYTDYRLFVKSGYSFTDDTRLSVNLRYFKSSLGFGLTSTVNNDERITAGSKVLIGPYLEFKPFGILSATIGGYFRNVHGVYLDQYNKTGEPYPLPSIFDVQSGDFDIDGKCSATLLKINTVTLGFDQLWNTIDFGVTSNRETRVPSDSAAIPVRKTLTNTGIYLQDETDLFSVIHLIPAIRLDYHSTYGTNISPKIGVAVGLDDKVTIRSSFGKAYRAPSATELYMPVMYFSPVYLKSNPDLKPEYTTSFDFGFQLGLPYGINVSSDYFYNNLSNLVVLGDVELGTTNKVSHVNVSDAWSWGFENEINWKKFKWLSAKINYAYTESKNITFNHPLDLVPQHKANVQVDISKQFKNGVAGLSIDESYVGERAGANWRSFPDEINFDNGKIMMIPHYVTLGEYYKTDITVYLTFASRYTLSVNAQNLFNRKIEESFGTLSPNRFAVVKLKVIL